MKTPNTTTARTLGPIAAALVFLATLNLRPAITAVGPVIDEIGATFNIGPALLGLLGSMPLIMFALMSSVGSFVAAKMGTDRVIFVVLIAIATGIAVRSYLGEPGLWVGVVLAAAAIAIGNVLVPALIKRDYPKKVAVATGIYTATMGLGASLASGFAVPVANKNGWQFSLALWALPAIIVALLWIIRINASTPQKPVGKKPKSGVWSFPTAWWLTLFMGIQSASFYFMITWLPAIQVSVGKTPEESGIILFWYQIVGITAGLMLPLIMGQKTDQRVAAFVSGTPILLGFLGLLFFEEYGFLWAVILGIGSGCSLVVALTLIALRAQNGIEISKLSGMVQSLGYLIAALIPVAAGILLEIFTSWTPALVMMCLLAAFQLGISNIVGRGKRKTVTTSTSMEK